VTRLHFGECVFDNETRELLRRGRPVPLSPKAFQLLEILVEHRPKALSKSDLHDRLWPNTFVVEGNLSNLIGEVRRALDDHPQHSRFIRTIHRFGYAFRDDRRGSDEGTPGESSLRLRWAGGRALLGEGEHIIGRDPDAAVVVDSPSVSRHHARIRVADGRAVFEDLGSKNGSRVGGRRAAGPVALAGGDVITIGGIDLTFFEFRPMDSTRTVMPSTGRRTRADSRQNPEER
jgi:DNA-binding winged helix-turn-helix (wHTH) protein